MSEHQATPVDTRRAQLRAAQIEQARKRKNQRIAIVAVCVVLAIALVAVMILVAGRFSAAKVAAAPPSASAQRTGIRVHPGDAKQGAPVVSLFIDYQCPACAGFEAAYGRQLERLAENGDIQLEYRTMTFLDAVLRNDSSTRAANAAACSDLAGRYAEYHNAVFANQPGSEGVGYTDEQLTQTFAAEAGITDARLQGFTTCYDERRYEGFVNSVDQEAGRAGITGTPTLQVNGNILDLSVLTDDPNSLHDEIMKLK